MILPDVNIVIHAFRPGSAEHECCARWLQDVLDGDGPYGMSPQVLAAAARILTHRRIFEPPNALADVIDYANVLLGAPHCQVIQPGPRHWETFCRLCRDGNACGPLIQDAWFAALAIESGCEWITLDRDYARFPGLRWRTP